MDTLLLEIRAGVATLTLNRLPQKNALNPAMRADLIAAVDTVRRSDEVRALVITGAGQDFCSGADIRTMGPEATDGSSPEATRARILATHEWLQPLLSLDRPVITAVDGVAYGGGFSLAVAGDILLVTARARLCCSFLRVGLVPDCGVLYTLPRLVGTARAKALLFSTHEINGIEAQAIGLAHEVCEPESLLPKALRIATCLAAAGPAALSMTKRGLDMSLGTDLRGMLEYEATAQGVASASQAHRQAVASFVQKLPPAYAGWEHKT
jgi:2-(1,2-epoxy-1,2-dihydrophenyl)acetyl-CoA isomerase